MDLKSTRIIGLSAILASTTVHAGAAVTSPQSFDFATMYDDLSATIDDQAYAGSEAIFHPGIMAYVEEQKEPQMVMGATGIIAGTIAENSELTTAFSEMDDDQFGEFIDALGQDVEELTTAVRRTMSGRSSSLVSFLTMIVDQVTALSAEVDAEESQLKTGTA